MYFFFFFCKNKLTECIEPLKANINYLKARITIEISTMKCWVIFERRFTISYKSKKIIIQIKHYINDTCTREITELSYTFQVLLNVKIIKIFEQL